MALIQTSHCVADLRGSFGGVYFSRDRSGLHCCAMPRVIHRRSPHQDEKRKAFSRARAFSKDNATVSYNIYRAYAGLPMGELPA